MGVLVLGAKVHHMLAREVGSIVGDDGMRKPEASNDVLPKKFHYLLSCEFGERHRLYPLGEAVGSYQEEPELGQSSSKRAHYIEPPLHRGSGVPQSVKVFARPVGDGSEPLTLWALPHVFLGVIKHLGLVILLLMALWVRDRPPV